MFVDLRDIFSSNVGKIGCRIWPPVAIRPLCLKAYIHGWSGGVFLGLPFFSPLPTPPLDHSARSPFAQSRDIKGTAWCARSAAKTRTRSHRWHSNCSHHFHGGHGHCGHKLTSFLSQFQTKLFESHFVKQIYRVNVNCTFFRTYACFTTPDKEILIKYKF